MALSSEIKMEFVEKLLKSNTDEIIAWTQKVIDSGMSPIDFFNDVFTPGMTIIGEKFSHLEIFIPELIDSSEKAKAISNQVLDPLFSQEANSKKRTFGKVIIASVKGDIHDIGKNMVVLMLQVNGFDVIDMGVDVAPTEIIKTAREEDVDIVGLSSLMTTSMPYMKEVVEMRDGFGLTEKFSIIVGGAPITKEYSDLIGADAFGKDASEAVEKCKLLVKAMNES